MTGPTIPTYQFDPTGTLDKNKITGEQQILTAGSEPDFHLIVPKLAPYFKNSLKVMFQPVGGGTVPLTEGIDYYCTHQFHDASLACATPICGSISFLNWTLAGVVQLEYQTIGGIWNIDAAAIAQILADRLHNPRITTWEQVTDQPVSFPVIDHEWNLVDLVGMSQVVAALNTIEVALRQTGSTGLAAHLVDYTNPHKVNATQVGLGNVQNFGIATNADAVAGTRNDAYMTPIATAAAIAALPSQGLANHLADHSNPHGVTAAQVGLGNVQNYGIASTADAQTGTRDDVYMTPLKTATLVGTGFGQALATHESDYTNPHHVSAHQVGAYTQAETDAAISTALSTAQGGTGTVNTALTTHINDHTNPHQVTAGQVGAYTTGQVDALLANKLSTTAQAADSALLQGQSISQIITQALQGTAANANQFAGQSPAAFTAAVLGGTAANAAALNNLTAAQIISDAQAASVKIVNIPATSGEAAGTYYRQLGTVPLLQAGDAVTKYADTTWLVAGGDSNGQTAGSTYYVHVSARGASPNQVSIEAHCLSSVDAGAVFGYTISGTNAIIWMQTSANAGQISISELATGAATLAPMATRQAAVPSGLTNATTTSYVTSDQLSAVVTAMTTAYNNLASSLA